MKLQYSTEIDIPMDVWNKHKKTDTLVELVEDAGYLAISEAMSNGFTGKIKDVAMEIVPNFDEDRSKEVVKVVIFYDTPM